MQRPTIDGGEVLATCLATIILYLVVGFLIAAGGALALKLLGVL